jgi:hypothetical protein
MLKCKSSDKYYTSTTDGKIYHLEARIGGYNLCLPVKITPQRKGQPIASRDMYGYCYALPAGRVISLNGEIRR